MCGISGIYRFFAGDFGTSAQDRSIVEAMNSRLERRGPDDQGIHQEPGLTLGNRRLAIQDLSGAGHMPMMSADERFVISFNGEIYNHRELLEELPLEASELRSHSDTEVILHAWSRWGDGALHRMVGQWAIALYDRQERVLWLCRDRFGEKPLYIHRHDHALSFASSLSALIEVPWVSRQLDERVLSEYLTLRYVVAPRTVLAGVSKLPPGHLMRLHGTDVNLVRWYAPRFHRPRGRRSSRRWIEEFDALFRQACRRCLIGDVPVALFLSDGIDSNGIRAALREERHDIPAYTFVPVEGSGEPSLGGTTPEGAVEVRVPAGHRVEQMVPALSSLTEPVGDGAALATWLLVRGARQAATVFLVGHGGDEMLGGYRLSYAGFRMGLWKLLSPLPSAWFEASTTDSLFGSEPFAQRWERIRDRPAWQTPDAVRYLIHKPLPAPDLDQLLGSAASDPYLGTVDELYRTSDARHALDRIQEVLVPTFLSSNLLSWADAVAMDASAEMRLPFLDRDLVEFVLGLPPNQRAIFWPGRTRTKRILRRWGRGRIDPAVLKRGKHGFPFGNLPQLMASDGETLRGYLLDSTALRRALPGLEAWLDGLGEAFTDSREGTLWALLALALWCDRHGVD